MTTQIINVPDLGTSGSVDVIELFIKEGDVIAVDAPLITLESDKASMEVPSPKAGTVKKVLIKIGDKVKPGDAIFELEASDAPAPAEKQPEPAVAKAPEPVKTPEPIAEPVVEKAATPAEPVKTSNGDVHAGPSVRRVAREFGVDLSQVSASGPRGRILKEDVQAFVKQRLSQPAGGFALPGGAPAIDFSQFGEIETVALSKIKRFTGVNVHRSWVSIPHVTQFDEADITELEAFRQANKNSFKEQGVNLTPLVFIMKAVVSALKAFPQFNASLDASGAQLILKKYYNLGVAVETPNGLVVPVIRDVDSKGIMQLAIELAEISKKAREKGLTPLEMQGSCFTISSLGGIGGTAFTPIINAPDVAILGISKSKQQPVYQNGAFVPRLMLPLSLSYDHRVIDGAEAARFSQMIANNLSDIRRLLF